MPPFVSIDIETCGLNPRTDSVIEFGAVINIDGKPLNQLPKFEAFIDQKQLIGHPTAFNMHKDLLELYCERRKYVRYLRRDDLVPAFKDFLEEYYPSAISTKIVIAGKNFMGFDYQFLKRMGFDTVRFHHRVLDPGSMYYNKGDLVPPDLNTCYWRCFLKNCQIKHRALDDAIDVVSVIRGFCGTNVLEIGSYEKASLDDGLYSKIVIDGNVVAIHDNNGRVLTRDTTMLGRLC
jgi:DNA polymerase III alpha subunit (gram-positive type)